MSWHDSWDKMKQRPHVLVVCPQAVASSWRKVVTAAAAGEFKPWRHQTQAAEWFASRLAGMIAADMGTGKTLIALLALTLLGKQLRFLDLTIGSSKSRAKRLREAMQQSGKHIWIVCVNYEAVWRSHLSPDIEAVRWSGIVLDESHRIKSASGAASRFMARLAAKQPLAKRLCLTGTPMPHSPLDLFGQFRFLDATVFGPSITQMRRRYAVCHPRFPSMVRQWVRQDELAAKLDANAWRVTADEVLDLPDAIHETVRVELTDKVWRFYQSLESEMTAEIESGTVTVANALTKLLRMQQATSGYARVDGSSDVVPIDGTPAKRMVLQDRLEDLPATEPVVVFCKFRCDLDDVAAAARALGREYAEVSGERKDLERWQRGEATIIGVQMQSGGVGIDLSRSAYAFYYSLGFSLGDYEQSLARLRRPGQTRCVRYYHLVCADTVDEQVYTALRNRRNVVEAVIGRLATRTEAA